MFRETLAGRTSEESQGFQGALTDLCACIIGFLCAAHRVCKANVVKRTYLALWDSTAIVAFEKTIKSLEETVRIEVEIHIDQMLLSAVDTITNMDDIVDALERDRIRKERINVLNWVSSTSVEDDHDDLRRQRAKDTCTWILRRSEFVQWRTFPSPLVLWIHGIRKICLLSNYCSLTNPFRVTYELCLITGLIVETNFDGS